MDHGRLCLGPLGGPQRFLGRLRRHAHAQQQGLLDRRLQGGTVDVPQLRRGRQLLQLRFGRRSLARLACGGDGGLGALEQRR